MEQESKSLHALAQVFGNKKDRQESLEKGIPQVSAELIDLFRGDGRESAAHDGLHLIEGVSVCGKHFIINAANAEHDSDDPFW
ncbi:MAG TPA: hypothetical protein VLR50_11520 [Desulfobacterales bacterium]|nr:hypothetical protein [Desulfobacterales bacterium]